VNFITACFPPVTLWQEMQLFAAASSRSGVHRRAQMSAPTRVRRFCLSVETLVLAFRISHDAPEHLPDVASIGVVAALLLAAWACLSA